MKKSLFLRMLAAEHVKRTVIIVGLGLGRSTNDMSEDEKLEMAVETYEKFRLRSDMKELSTVN